MTQIIDLSDYRPSWADDVEFVTPELVSHRTGRHLMHAMAEDEAQRPRRGNVRHALTLIAVSSLFVFAIGAAAWVFLGDMPK